MIAKGGDSIRTMYFGTVPVKKAFQGAVQVWPSSSLELSPSSLTFTAEGGSGTLTINVADGQAWSITLPDGFSASATSGTGTTTITITASNNESDSARTGTLTVTSGDLQGVCTLSQEAGMRVYGEVNVTLSYDTIAAGGGTVYPVISYSQTWTWNGVSGSGGTVTDGGSIVYSGTGVEANTGAVTAETLGTTATSSETEITTVTATVTMNGVVGNGTATVMQEANTATYEAPVATLTYPTIVYTGGEADPTINASQTVSYTSGATETITTYRIRQFSLERGIDWAEIDESTGVVTAQSNRNTQTSRSAGVSLSLDVGSSSTDTIGTVTQEEYPYVDLYVRHYNEGGSTNYIEVYSNTGRGVSDALTIELAVQTQSGVSQLYVTFAVPNSISSTATWAGDWSDIESVEIVTINDSTANPYVGDSGQLYYKFNSTGQ